MCCFELGVHSPSADVAWRLTGSPKCIETATFFAVWHCTFTSRHHVSDGMVCLVIKTVSVQSFAFIGHLRS